MCDEVGGRGPRPCALRVLRDGEFEPTTSGVRLFSRGDRRHIETDGGDRPGGGRIDGRRHAACGAVDPSARALRFFSPAVRSGHQSADRPLPRIVADVAEDDDRRARKLSGRRGATTAACGAALADSPGAPASGPRGDAGSLADQVVRHVCRRRRVSGFRTRVGGSRRRRVSRRRLGRNADRVDRSRCGGRTCSGADAARRLRGSSCARRPWTANARQPRRRDRRRARSPSRGRAMRIRRIRSVPVSRIRNDCRSGCCRTRRSKSGVHALPRRARTRAADHHVQNGRVRVRGILRRAAVRSARARPSGRRSILSRDAFTHWGCHDRRYRCHRDRAAQTGVRQRAASRRLSRPAHVPCRRRVPRDEPPRRQAAPTRP